MTALNGLVSKKLSVARYLFQRVSFGERLAGLGLFRRVQLGRQHLWKFVRAISGNARDTDVRPTAYRCPPVRSPDFPVARSARAGIVLQILVRYSSCCMPLGEKWLRLINSSHRSGTADGLASFGRFPLRFILPPFPAWVRSAHSQLAFLEPFGRAISRCTSSFRLSRFGFVRREFPVRIIPTPHRVWVRSARFPGALHPCASKPRPF
jgi:hypothetical protein